MSDGLDLAAIRARAEAATPGPWTLGRRRDGSICGIDDRDGYGDVVWPGDVECASHCLGGGSTIAASDETWAHIAGMDPATTLALVDELERLTASLEVTRRRLTADGHPEDRINMAVLHIDAALDGKSRPLALAEAELEQLRAKIAVVEAVVNDEYGFTYDAIRAVVEGWR